MSDDNTQANTSEEVRAKVIESYEIADTEDNSTLINKLTTKEVENQKNLSKTIEQKAKYRDLGVKNGLLDPTTFEPIEKKPEGEPLKTNTEQTGLTREEGIFFAQGGTEETFKIAKQVADTQGIGILAAKEDDYFKFQVGKIEEEAKVKSNQIGASNGSPTGTGHQEKPIGDMTKDEHKAHFDKRVNG